MLKPAGVKPAAGKDCLPHLKRELQAEAELALVNAVSRQVGDAGDACEIVEIINAAVSVQHKIGDVCVRVGEMGRVAEVERLHTELQLEAFGELEQAMYAEIPVHQS